MSEARTYRDFASYYGQSRDRDYRQTGGVGDMLGAFSDWDRSGGGYGGGCCCGGGYGGTSASFFSDGTLFALLAGAALAFYILYTTITMANAGGGRRRRNARKTDQDSANESPFIGFEDIVWQGLEEFEEKIDRIAEGQDTGDDNWISKIYNQFSFFNDVDNKLTESDLDGIEPPILDETWGLGIRNSSVFKANTTIEEPVKLEDEEKSRSKREVHDEDMDDVISDPEEKCRVDMWRCLSRVIEGGLHYIDHPEGIYSLAKKTMFKVAFHGGVTNVWSGLMTIPEARQIKKCMNSHSECVSYEVLRREAQDTMDPTDPSVKMYQKKESGKMVEKEQSSEEKVVKKERLIIVPEFVESLDQGDGSQQYEEDDYSSNQL